MVGGDGWGVVAISALVTRISMLIPFMWALLSGPQLILIKSLTSIYHHMEGGISTYELCSGGGGGVGGTKTFSL